MEKIKIIKDVISSSNAKLIIDYIDNNLSVFTHDHSEKRFHQMFGIDLYHGSMCKPFIDDLDGIDDLIKDQIEVIKDKIYVAFKEKDLLFLSSIWFAKQLPGGEVTYHIDRDDDESNSHFEYSAILYLNDIDEGGVLDFPNLDISIKPKFGDLIVFLSDGEDMLHGVKIIGEDRYTVPMWFTKDPSFEVPFI